MTITHYPQRLGPAMCYCFMVYYCYRLMYKVDVSANDGDLQIAQACQQNFYDLEPIYTHQCLTCKHTLLHDVKGKYD